MPLKENCMEKYFFKIISHAKLKNLSFFRFLKFGHVATLVTRQSHPSILWSCSNKSQKPLYRCYRHNTFWSCSLSSFNAGLFWKLLFIRSHPCIRSRSQWRYPPTGVATYTPSCRWVLLTLFKNCKWEWSYFILYP